MSIVPVAVQKFVSNPKTAAIVENTIIAVGSETALKMIGRPTFIMMDKEADSPEKRKYAAAKEMLYQGICLTLYLSLMTPVKHVIYKGFTKVLSKNPENAAKLEKYNNLRDSVANVKKQADETLKGLKDKAQIKTIKAETLKKVNQLKSTLKSDPDFHLGKGVKEFSAIIGSILMLTVVAPQISHVVIHPLMRALGFEKPAEKAQKIDKQA